MTDDFDARRTLAVAIRERTRRHFFADCGVGLGAMALASLFEGERCAGATPDGDHEASRSVARSQPKTHSIGPLAIHEGCRGRHDALAAQARAAGIPAFFHD